MISPPSRCTVLWWLVVSGIDLSLQCGYPRPNGPYDAGASLASSWCWAAWTMPAA
jgi:hypothetical protein